MPDSGLRVKKFREKCRCHKRGALEVRVRVSATRRKGVPPFEPKPAQPPKPEPQPGEGKASPKEHREPFAWADIVLAQLEIPRETALAAMRLGRENGCRTILNPAPAAAGDVYRLSGMWAPFFHDLSYLFGTEGLLLLMITDPDVIHEATRRICEFYLAANERFFEEAPGLIACTPCRCAPRVWLPRNWGRFFCFEA